MDADALEPRASGPAGAGVRMVDGVLVAPLSAVVERLRVDYPAQSPVYVEAVVLREWEAFSAGRPLVIPAAVEEGAREILDQSPA